MTFTQRLRSFFFRTNAPVTRVATPVAASLAATSIMPTERDLSQNTILPITPTVQTAPEPLPYWLMDEESLRDEGVLFGLSDARPDEKVTEIRSYFGQQAAPLEMLVEQYSEKIGELNLFIEQRENRITDVSNRLKTLQNRQPTENNLVRTVVSLILSVVMCVGNFYLIDETVQPVFPNHWISVGVFLAGMFNLFGRTSFFYEEGTQLTSRRLIEELGLPFAASVFVLAQALQTQAIWQSGALFIFVFFLFLLAGKLLLGTLTQLQNGVSSSQKNRQLVVEKQQNIPVWEAEIERLNHEIDTVRAQKWPIVTALNHTQTDLTRLNIKRDQVVNLFLSEFELAHSLRDRLTDQQRKSIMTGSSLR